MTRSASAADRLMVALDVPTLAEATAAVDRLAGTVKWFKIGKQLFTAEGPAVVAAIKKRGGRVFLDLKYHDIPATVSHAVRAAADLGVEMVNLHALGGTAMMRAAAEGLAAHCAATGAPRPLLIAVTVLTSMSQHDLREVGIDATPRLLVAHLAELARQSGLDGVVASPEELAVIRERCGASFVTVTPGVRPVWAGKDDQQRVATPAQAVKDGAHYLVVGRPILKAADPVAAARKILDEMSSPQG